MGGGATITLVGASAGLLDDCFDLADRCEQRWSRFQPTSDISRLNWAEGRPVEVDPLTVGLLESMRHAARLTLGAYDPTLLPLLLEAGYTTSAVDPTRVTRLPASARAPGNLAAIEIRDGVIRMPVGMTLDPGGVGKGLTADLICELALASGAWGVMAEIGGDIAVAGTAPDGTAWRLGVENPFDLSAHSAVVRLQQGALATSSQRKKRFGTEPGHAGERHHLLDPAGLRSAVTPIQTVSVIASSGARAEALTKPGFLRDPRDYLAWLPTVGAAGLMIDDTGALMASENWTLYA
ncbi:FAD:protein FMN transferase [Cryobacterium melibiosiphilum]|uniref:FAD:protein FMN transferase n=2 Tax=Cryobacterium melibiosiphilum TaxID=995039 RepID=A0A3A5MBM2_9MICO|nr:FAD:protein FMN transferase [Cryobacterium melibiosiphilum]